MLDLVYMILVFIIISMSIQISGGIFIMPYLLYLANSKTYKSIIITSVIALIYSLQTDMFFKVLIFFIIFYILFIQVLKYFQYIYINILFFSLIEQIIWCIFFEREFNFIRIFMAFIFYNLFNYIFIKIYKKSKTGVVQ